MCFLVKLRVNPAALVCCVFLVKLRVNPAAWSVVMFLVKLRVNPEVLVCSVYIFWQDQLRANPATLVCGAILTQLRSNPSALVGRQTTQAPTVYWCLPYSEEQKKVPQCCVFILFVFCFVLLLCFVCLFFQGVRGGEVFILFHSLLCWYLLDFWIFLFG